MNSKVLVQDYASLLEYRLMDAEATVNLKQANVIVNPYYTSPFRKKIIINLPYDIQVMKLNRNNDVVARFPIYPGIKVEEYNLPDDRTFKSKEEYSLLILNKYMLLDISKVKLVDKTNFLIGTDVEIDGSLTAVGRVLLKNKIEDLV